MGLLTRLLFGRRPPAKQEASVVSSVVVTVENWLDLQHLARRPFDSLEAVKLESALANWRIVPASQSEHVLATRLFQRGVLEAANRTATIYLLAPAAHQQLCALIRYALTLPPVTYVQGARPVVFQERRN